MDDRFREFGECSVDSPMPVEVGVEPGVGVVAEYDCAFDNRREISCG